MGDQELLDYLKSQTQANNLNWAYLYNSPLGDPDEVRAAFSVTAKYPVEVVIIKKGKNYFLEAMVDDVVFTRLDSYSTAEVGILYNLAKAQQVIGVRAGNSIA